LERAFRRCCTAFVQESAERIELIRHVALDASTRYNVKQASAALELRRSRATDLKT
jgi:hypothetical protein